MKEKYHPRFYNLKAKFLGLTPVYKKAISLVEPKVGDSILDVACGTGKFLRLLDEKLAGQVGVKLFGIDINSEMIDRAKHDAGDSSPIKFKIASATEIPFVDLSFDWVASTLSAHHMTSAEKIAFAREAFRVLKPDGQFLISDLGRPRSWVGKLLAFLSHSHTDSAKNMEIMEAEVIKAGFKIQKIYPQFGYIEHLLGRKPNSPPA